jgi:hypothetical protein
LFPFFVLDEGHEGVDVARSFVLSEFAVQNVENCGQGGDQKAARQRRRLGDIDLGRLDSQIIRPVGEVVPCWGQILAGRAPGSVKLNLKIFSMFENQKILDFAH